MRCGLGYKSILVEVWGKNVVNTSFLGTSVNVDFSDIKPRRSFYNSNSAVGSLTFPP